MLVKEVMTKNVATIDPSKNIFEAAKLMHDLDIGSIPVSDGIKLRGMITDRDITLRATANEMDPSSTLVKDVLIPNIIYCYEDQTLEEVNQVMQNKKIRRLPVVNRNQRLVGLISLGDIATQEISEEIEKSTQSVA